MASAAASSVHHGCRCAIQLVIAPAKTAPFGWKYTESSGIQPPHDRIVVERPHRRDAHVAKVGLGRPSDRHVSTVEDLLQPPGGSSDGLRGGHRRARASASSAGRQPLRWLPRRRLRRSRRCVWRNDHRAPSAHLVDHRRDLRPADVHRRRRIRSSHRLDRRRLPTCTGAGNRQGVRSPDRTASSDVFGRRVDDHSDLRGARWFERHRGRRAAGALSGERHRDAATAGDRRNRPRRRDRPSRHSRRAARPNRAEPSTPGAGPIRRAGPAGSDRPPTCSCRRRQHRAASFG